MGMVRNYQKELDKIIERINALQSERRNPPALLMHSCCAPCSSYVLEYLRPFFRITVFYYNPNISMDEEYRKRAAEQKRLIEAYNERLAGSPCGVHQINQAASSCVSQPFRTVCQPASCTEQAAGRTAAQPAQSAARPADYAANRSAYPIDIIEGDYEPEEFFATVKGLEQCREGGERCFACYEMRLRKTSQIAAEGKYDYFATTLTISPLKNAAKINEIGERIAGNCGVSWLPSDFKKRGGYQRSIELSKEYGLYRQNYCGCVYSGQERNKHEAAIHELPPASPAPINNIFNYK